jgi:hypothetical protein
MGVPSVARRSSAARRWDSAAARVNGSLRRGRAYAATYCFYARQAKNTEAERQACEIRLRAERRCGQLLKETEKAKGAQGTGSNQYQVRSIGTTAPTLSDRGISKDQSSRWQKLADVPEEQFEAALAGPDMPTTSGIIEAVKPPTVTPVSTDALRLWSALCGFEREN